MFVHLTCGPHSLVARMESPEQPMAVGQTLEVEVKLNRTHLFDRETLQTIV
jgi:multiple sugar transport system ATP-binding protein